MTTTTTDSIPKAVLYYFTGSVWSAVPELLAIEKGFDETILQQRSVNLMVGANFNPSFLKVSPKGTIPALVVPYSASIEKGSGETKFKSLTSTVEICDFLDTCTLGLTPQANTIPKPSLSPATIQGSTESKFLIDLVHSSNEKSGTEAGAPDANEILLGFRSKEERELKWNGMVGMFLNGRQKALERYRKEGESEDDVRLDRFYDLKIKENSALISLFTSPSIDISEYITKSHQHWKDLSQTLKVLEATLVKSKSTYLIGDQISLADLHVGAYLIRIIAASGTKSLKELNGFNSQLEPSGETLGPLSLKWLETLLERESFKTIYKNGFH